jgi:RNA polymerase sigma-70 factor (ECF subfamily)
MDDDSLMAAVAHGDHVALREVFTRHAPWLAARLRRLLPADAVEDVLQETFIAVWRGARGYQADGRLGAWLWGIARRQAALLARQNGHADVTAEPAASADPATIAIANVDLDRALATLGPAGNEQRELVRLVFVEDRSMADVAAQLGIPTGTVKSRVYKVRHLLQAALRQGGR